MVFNRKKLIVDVALSGLKKGFIADKAKINRAYLYMILKGLRKPSNDVLKRIYKVLIGDVR